jgi:hypothetical protein
MNVECDVDMYTHDTPHSMLERRIAQCHFRAPETATIGIRVFEW